MKSSFFIWNIKKTCAACGSLCSFHSFCNFFKIQFGQASKSVFTADHNWKEKHLCNKSPSKGSFDSLVQLDHLLVPSCASVHLLVQPEAKCVNIVPEQNFIWYSKDQLKSYRRLMNSSRSSMFIGGLCWMPSVKKRENFVPRSSLHQATWNIKWSKAIRIVPAWLGRVAWNV